MATAFIEALALVVDTAAAKDAQGCARAMLATRMATISAMSGGPDDAVRFASELLALVAGDGACETKKEAI